MNFQRLIVEPGLQAARCMAVVTAASLACSAPLAAAPQAKPARAQAKAAPPRASSVKPKIDPALTAAYKRYGDELQPRIVKGWNHPVPQSVSDPPVKKNHVILEVTVNPDGSAGAMQLTSTPKSSEAEQAAVDAFNQAQPLPPLPAGSPPCKLICTFDSTATQFDSNTNFQMKLDPLPPQPVQSIEPASESSPPAEPATPAESEDKTE